MDPKTAEKLQKKIWREMSPEERKEKRKDILEFLKKLNKIGQEEDD